MDVEIFPHRLLSADTTEKLLRNLEWIEGVEKMVIQGQRLPPAQGGHPDRRIIIVKDEEIDLQVKTGRILLEIEDEEILDEIRAICEDVLPFGFNIYLGTFIRKLKTVSDKLKYGDKLDELPDEMIGLTDQNARLTERASIIRKDE